MRPNLLVDDRWRDGGIHRFFTELVARLDSRFRISGLTERWHLKRALNPLNPIWLPGEIDRRHADVFWSPGFMSPAWSRVPFVFTVHDLIHARAVRGLRAAYFEYVLRPLCKKAYKIVTVSEFSRNEICEWAGLPPDRVVRIYNAVSKEFVPEGAKFSPGYPYLLYVGVRSAHKNLPRVVEAFAKSGLIGQCKLVLSGEPEAKLAQLAADFRISDSLRFAGRIPDANLPSYYRGAIATLMLSTYEGFGLPALESLACGTPVLCSNTTSLPEVVDAAGLLVNPMDVAEMADGMTRIVHDEAFRRMLMDRGLARISAFSWKESSAMLSSLLLEATNGQRS